jgi:hypothetical protein
MRNLASRRGDGTMKKEGLFIFGAPRWLRQTTAEVTRDSHPDRLPPSKSPSHIFWLSPPIVVAIPSLLSGCRHHPQIQKTQFSHQFLPLGHFCKQFKVAKALNARVLNSDTTPCRERPSQHCFSWINLCTHKLVSSMSEVSSLLLL